MKSAQGAQGEVDSSPTTEACFDTILRGLPHRLRQDGLAILAQLTEVFWKFPPALIGVDITSSSFYEALRLLEDQRNSLRALPVDERPTVQWNQLNERLSAHKRAHFLRAQFAHTVARIVDLFTRKPRPASLVPSPQ